MNMTYSKHENGIRCRLADHHLELTWFGAEMIRIRAWKTAAPRFSSLTVMASPSTPADWGVVEQPDYVELKGALLSARVDGHGAVSFFRQGRALLAEQAGTRAFPLNDLGKPGDEHGAEQRFELSADEALYGLGQFLNQVANWRGQEATLIHGNVTVAVPFLVSTRGWGMLWDNASHTTFRDDTAGMRLWSEVADGIDYYVVAGGNLDAVVAGYRRLTGAAPLFARSFYGYIQSKERYKTAAELAEVVREYRRRGLPLDVIVQDWLYWGPGMERWSGMRHDPETYGDLAGAISEIHGMGAKVMISIWPRIGVGTALGRELAAGGHLFVGRPADQDKVYDAFSPAAREIYWRHAKEGLFDLGVDAWWMDGTEPEFEDCHDTARHKRSCVAQRDTVAGSWARLLNAYSLATTGGVYEHQRAVTSDKRVMILTRSAFAGQQRYAAATWSGDVGANWATLAAHIPAGLHFCLAGIPYWTSDNGAFFVSGRGGIFPKGVADPAYREFYLRWFQYSCFCPLMRSHGTQTPREVWQFGKPGEAIYEALAAFARLRMRLLPYSYSLAAMTAFEGYTPMRALAMDFAGDKRVHDIADQFMYGPVLMVCPVTRPMVHMPTETLGALGLYDMSTEDRPGWRVRVYDGLEAATPATEHVDKAQLDYNWGGNVPAGATSPLYRVEFSGRLLPRGTARQVLLVRVAGRVRVEFDGARVVDDWREGGLREHRIEVDPSRHHGASLRIEYGHTAGEAVIQVGWEINREWTRDGTLPACERDVYLPPVVWYDFWTGERLEGGRVETRPSPLERIPVLARAGSILLLGPEKQWQNQVSDEVIEVRVYPGADGMFTLYEDDSESYAYEQGKCSRIAFTWDDRSRTLTVGERQGRFDGMLERRKFRVVLVGTGIAPSARCAAEIVYDGTRQTVWMGEAAEV